MIDIQHLTKQYGRIKAVDDISFTVNEGEIVGFLGPNGAGKTTTMNILTGYIPSTEGVVRVGGFDVMEDPELVKRQIGYLPEQPPVYGDLTVLEYLSFVYDLKKAPREGKWEHIDEVMEVMKIEDHQNRLIRNLSKGYKQRVGFAQALIGDPKLLILDEPTVGLDPRQIIEIRKLITALGKRHTIILSSHILQEVQAVCERVIIINKGRIAAVDTPENLSRQMGTVSRLALTIVGSSGKVTSALEGIYGVKRVDRLGERDRGVYSYELESDKEVDVRRQIFAAMAQLGCPIIEMRGIGMTLEDIFLELVTSDRTLASADGAGEDGTGAGGASAEESAAASESAVSSADESSAETAAQDSGATGEGD